MKINQRGIDLIKKFEGLYLKPYYCPANLKTIGYGHVILPHENFDDGITEDEAEDILKRDLTKFENGLRRLINAPINSNQFSSLCSFSFNLGLGAFQRSTLRMVVNRGEHDRVREQLMRWNRAGGKVLKGLTKRRKAEADLYEL
jgi:lysozyme